MVYTTITVHTIPYTIICYFVDILPSASATGTTCSHLTTIHTPHTDDILQGCCKAGVPERDRSQELGTPVEASDRSEIDL
jgi:hypothetical protein